MLLMNSEKSLIESLLTRASRGWGAFCLCLELAFDGGRGVGLKGDLTDRGASTTGAGCICLLTEDE